MRKHVAKLPCEVPSATLYEPANQHVNEYAATMRALVTKPPPCYHCGQLGYDCMWQIMNRFTSIARRYGYVFSVASIVCATALFYVLREDFAKGQWALIYLLIVGFVAGVSGVRPALLAAVMAFLAWNYFLLPPYVTLQIHDPKDWLSLVVFLIVAVAMGLQTGRMREREEQALARERETALLNRFSAHLVSDISVADMADVLLGEVRTITGARCAAVYLPDDAGRLNQSCSLSDEGCVLDPFVPSAAEWVYRQSKAIGLPYQPRQAETQGRSWPISVDHSQSGATSPRQDVFVPMQTARRQEGVLYVGERRDGEPYSAPDSRLLVALANHGAAFLERKHLQSVAVQADVLREADKLKSTLVSSVSHELKTPIASITATVSNLLEDDIEWDAANVRRELEAVEEDLGRLNSSIGALLDLSRLESSAWEPHVEAHEFGEVLGTAISKLPQKQRGRVSFSLPEDLPLINVDFQQWARALENLIENALSYSPSESPVRVGAAMTESAVRMWVEDEGPGIKPEDRERIFEKFYRGETRANTPYGTGLGLAVTREIVRFHGGRIWVEDVSPHGARFVMTLPQEGIDSRT